MACLMDLYRKVDVFGQVTEQALKKYVGSLRSKKTGHLGSASETNEPSSTVLQPMRGRERHQIGWTQR
eukprot:6486270-Amphidinium_carterae.1